MDNNLARHGSYVGDTLTGLSTNVTTGFEATAASFAAQAQAISGTRNSLDHGHSTIQSNVLHRMSQLASQMDSMESTLQVSGRISACDTHV